MQTIVSRLGVLIVLLIVGASNGEARNHLPNLLGVTLVCGTTDEMTDYSLWGQIQVFRWGWEMIIDLIIGVMGLMSGAILVERLLVFRAARQQTRLCLPHLIVAARHGGIEEAISIGEKYKKSHVAPAITAILRAFQSLGKDREWAVVAKDAGRSSARRGRLALSQGIELLGVIAATAPILGVLCMCLKGDPRTSPRRVLRARVA